MNTNSTVEWTKPAGYWLCKVVDQHGTRYGTVIKTRKGFVGYRDNDPAIDRRQGPWVTLSEAQTEIAASVISNPTAGKAII